MVKLGLNNHGDGRRAYEWGTHRSRRGGYVQELSGVVKRGRQPKNEDQRPQYVRAREETRANVRAHDGDAFGSAVNSGSLT
eukprot:6190061-Pleurochrysis_carterae.AAC.2